MGKKPRQIKPSFFKILSGDFTHQLQIPPAFVLRYKETLSKKLLLKTCQVRQVVKLKKKVGDKLFFRQGWTEFVEENDLGYGDLLVFRSLGCSKFFVKVYAKNGCEKNSALETSTDKASSSSTQSKEEQCKDAEKSVLFPSHYQTKHRKGRSLYAKSERVKQLGKNDEDLYFTSTCKQDTLQKIPKKLVHKLGDALSNIAYIKIPQGEFCQVELNKVDGNIFLGQGWQNFVRKHSLYDGDCLVFDYIGESCFSVCKVDRGLSDEHLCDTEEPITDKDYQLNDDDEEEETEDEDSQDILSVERCKSGTASKKNVVDKPEQLPTSTWKNNLPSTSHHFYTKSNSLSKSRLKSNGASRWKKTRDYRHVSSLDGSSPRQSRTNKKKKIQKGRTQLAGRKDMNQDEEKGGNTCGMNIDEDDVQLSASKHADSTDEEAQSDGSEPGRQVDGTFVHQVYERSATTGPGYSSKTEGLSKVNTKYLKLFGTNRKPVTLQEKRIHEAACGFKTVYPCFIVRLPRSYVTGGLVQIPMEFARMHLPKTSTKTCIMDPSERTWVANYTISEYRAYFCKAWKAIVLANKLKEGNVCVFELIDGENIKLKLTVLQNVN